MKLVRLHEAELPGIWPLIERYIVDATSRSAGRHTPETVFNMISTEQYQLWIVVDEDNENRVTACVVTQFLQYPTGLLAADIIIATGENRKQWIHLLETLEEWARDNGCQLFQMFARKGWARELKGDYHLSHVLLERRIDE